METAIRRQIVHEDADQLTYELRDIVAIAQQVCACGVEVYGENIGDPVQKGEKLPGWMKAIVSDLVTDDVSYGYTGIQGLSSAREFIAEQVVRDMLDLATAIRYSAHHGRSALSGPP